MNLSKGDYKSVGWEGYRDYIICIGAWVLHTVRFLEISVDQQNEGSRNK
jgi:hypothetical protein